MGNIDISLIGWTGKNNFGDDQLKLAITSFFQKLGCNVKDQGILQEVVVVGGGNIISHKFPLFKPENINKLKNEKVILFNVGLNNESGVLLAQLKKLNTLWVVRDFWSVEYLKSKGFNNVLWAPDICLYTFKQDNVERQRIVSVVCNYYIFKNIFSNSVKEKLFAERAYNQLANFLIWLKTFKWEIQLVPAHTAQEIDDRVTNAYLQGLLGGGAKMLYDNQYILNDLKRSSMIISTRYHTTIYALANQLPFIDLTFHSKNSNLHHDIGLTHHALNYYDFLQEDCIKNINEIENNPSHQEKIDNYRVKGQHSWKTIETEIYKYIT
jgi:polysaccharide pyruvyl transferase WcaK-like protein